MLHLVLVGLDIFISFKMFEGLKFKAKFEDKPNWKNWFVSPLYLTRICKIVPLSLVNSK